MQRADTVPSVKTCNMHFDPVRCFFYFVHPLYVQYVCHEMCVCLEHVSECYVCLHTIHTVSTHQSGPCIERQTTAVTQVAPSSRSSSSTLNPPPFPLRPPTFPNVSIRRALEFSGAQQEAGPVMWVALAAGGGAKAPGGRATLVPEDLIDGRAVLVGQGRRIGRRITILLGVCLGWGGVFFGGGGEITRLRPAVKEEKDRRWIVCKERGSKICK